MRKVYICSQCGYQSLKWLGRCPQCDSWESFVEKDEEVLSGFKFSSPQENQTFPLKLKEIPSQEHIRFSTGLKELDRVLGGGIVKGSSIILGGEPGIGKSTLSLQVCKNLCEEGKKVLYVSGEESAQQVRLRFRRLGEIPENFYIIAIQNIDRVLSFLEKDKYDFLVIDSIQVMYRPDFPSSPGSITQVKEVNLALSKFCKAKELPFLVIGHITKEGLLAGPKTLEHMVDVVLYFEGEKFSDYRILRAQKNRFGATNEIAVFEMTSRGLKEIDNPSKFFLSQYPQDCAGVSVSCVMEGTRPLLIEIQSLVCKSTFGVVRRRCEGIDYNRFLLLIAVIEKKMQLSLYNQDIFVNVAGKLKVEDVSSDLGVVVSIYSSFKEIVLPNSWCFIGEVSLTGNIRGVSFINQRIREVGKLGFERCFIPKSNLKEIVDKSLQVVPVSHIMEIHKLFK